MTIKKTINFEEEMIKEIEKLAEETERDFSGEVRWIIKEYLRLTKKT